MVKDEKKMTQNEKAVKAILQDASKLLPEKNLILSEFTLDEQKTLIMMGMLIGNLINNLKIGGIDVEREDIIKHISSGIKLINKKRE
jgi:hypothetical protein